MGHTTRLLLVTSLALFGCTDASDRTVEALERLQAHTAETVEALRDLATAQHDAFVEQAQEYVDGLDERIEELKRSTAEDTADRLAELEERREALAPLLDQLRQSGEEAWDQASEHFLDALDGFRALDDEPR